MTSGMNLAWASPMLVKLRNVTESPLSRPITDTEGSWIVSIGYLCSIFFTPFIAPVSDNLGRKYTIILTCVPKLIAALLYTLATEVWMLILGQALAVIADSWSFVVVPMYAAEISNKERRGSLGMLLQIFSSTGILITLAVGPFTSYMTINIIILVMTAVSALPVFWIPDSPYFLCTKGKIEEATKTLILLREQEILAKKEIEEYSVTMKRNTLNLKPFKTRVYLKSQLLALLMIAGAQLIGFQTVSIYLQTILENTKTSVRPEIASVIIGAVQLFSAFCMATITDRFGRRHILIVTLIGSCIGLIGLGTFFRLNLDEGYEVIGFMNYLPTISLMLFVFCYNAGVGSLCFTIISELFDGATRAVGVSISVMFSLVIVFVMGRYFAATTEAIGAAATFWIFAGNCAIVCLLLTIFMPETRGQSFAEIQDKLRGSCADCMTKENVSGTTLPVIT